MEQHTGETPPMPSKRNATAAETREPARPQTDGAAETKSPASRPAPAPRPRRGASVIPAPRKAELHRVAVAPRPLPTREQIAERAYEIWEQSGCIPGRDRENWAQAERELSAGCGPEISAQQA